MTSSLHVTLTGEPELQFAATDRITVGRDPSCDLVVRDTLVSREHCVIEWYDGRWTVVDTSSNGTFVGDERIDSRSLGGGEPIVLRLGNRDTGPAVTVRVGAPTTTSAEPTVRGPGTHLGQAVADDVAALHALSGEPLSIGRVSDNDVVVDDLLVSRHHATVRLNGPGAALVNDLGGRNGTFVNGHPVDRSALLPGDRLTIGRRTFSYDGVTTLIEHGRPKHASLAAENLQVRYGDTSVLSGVTFSVEPGTLLAIIGPSGAGKSTLLRALTGTRAADDGRVLVDGIDFYPAYDEVRHRVGLVPQEDVLHDQLKVAQALRYAAALRLPDDVSADVRDQKVDAVLAQLDLTAQQDLQISRLSGGQRKRASVAMELLTEPSLLYLDEPTSGLDPLLDREVMRQLRNLADRGRTVVVVTHSTQQLHLCHQVLVMARGGRAAYFGPPNELLAHFGADDYADAFTELSMEATAWASRYALSSGQARRTAPPVRAPIPPRQSRRRQFGLLLHRSAALIRADRRQLALLLGLPLVLAAVAQTAPADAGFVLTAGPPQTGAATLLIILILGAAFMGMAASIRELVAERQIYHRERAIGVRPGAYLGSKIALSALICVVQAVLLGYVGMLGRDLPAHGLIFASSLFELIVVLALTAFTAAMAGLLASAVAERTEHTMSILVVSVMGQLVLSGGLYSLGNRPWLQAIAVLSPTRWGFAASASTVDLRAFKILLPADAMWRHTTHSWWQAITGLAVLSLVFALGAFLAMRVREQRPRR